MMIAYAYGSESIKAVNTVSQFYVSSSRILAHGTADRRMANNHKGADG